jgi:hypothetical protein
MAYKQFNLAPTVIKNVRPSAGNAPEHGFQIVCLIFMSNLQINFIKLEKFYIFFIFKVLLFNRFFDYGRKRRKIMETSQKES